ncbi:hypothetical protein C7T94_09085 [Pedobacter yulinensis]|uniref:Uncharacterized protein n=1 Tax=Pedobacter yulinensis TaxID=2126353 RepID=A0A2T3HK01_9SPHI|nr:hypothetical protein [Pedobacter yulinensis]PST82788.1 hypothetical protein C7T94_09085 [Pedobacter yulinensis]
MQEENNSYKLIPGWGVDANPDDRPNYPMKKWTGDDHKRINWQRPALQQSSVEVLHSNERPSKSAVYGTTVPPTGLSGQIRRYAFRHSEDKYAHWLPLLLADRVNMVEGVIEDISSGHFPNYFKERGFTADWKYNRGAVIQKVVGAACVLLVWYAMSKTKKKKRFI